MKVWITKRRAFIDKASAMRYMVDLRKQVKAYAKEKGNPAPKEIKETDSMILFTIGCSSRAVRLVEVE